MSSRQETSLQNWKFIFSCIYFRACLILFNREDHIMKKRAKAKTKVAAKRKKKATKKAGGRRKKKAGGKKRRSKKKKVGGKKRRRKAAMMPM